MPASSPALRARQRIRFHPGRRLAVVANEEARLQAGPLAAQGSLQGERRRRALRRRARAARDTRRTARARPSRPLRPARRRRAARGRAAGAGEAAGRRRAPRRRSAPSAARRTSTSALPPRCSGCGAALATVPAGSLTSPATKTSCPAVGSDVAVEEEGAPLGRAAVLAARDDLLPRVAALLEIDAADELEVDHLRNEAIDRRRFDRDDAALDLEPAPGRERSSPARRRRRPRRATGAARRARCTPARVGQADRRGAAVRAPLPDGGIARASPSRPGRRRRTARSRRSRRSACTWRAGRTSTGASASARERWSGTRAGTRRRLAARR